MLRYPLVLATPLNLLAEDFSPLCTLTCTSTGLHGRSRICEMNAPEFSQARPNTHQLRNNNTLKVARLLHQQAIVVEGSTQQTDANALHICYNATSERSIITSTLPISPSRQRSSNAGNESTTHFWPPPIQHMPSWATIHVVASAASDCTPLYSLRLPLRVPSA